MLPSILVPQARCARFSLFNDPVYVSAAGTVLWVCCFLVRPPLLAPQTRCARFSLFNTIVSILAPQARCGRFAAFWRARFFFKRRMRGVAGLPPFGVLAFISAAGTVWQVCRFLVRSPLLAPQAWRPRFWLFNTLVYISAAGTVR